MVYFMAKRVLSIIKYELLDLNDMCKLMKLKECSLLEKNSIPTVLLDDSKWALINEKTPNGKITLFKKSIDKYVGSAEIYFASEICKKILENIEYRDFLEFSGKVCQTLRKLYDGMPDESNFSKVLLENCPEDIGEDIFYYYLNIMDNLNSKCTDKCNMSCDSIHRILLPSLLYLNPDVIVGESNLAGMYGGYVMAINAYRNTVLRKSTKCRLEPIESIPSEVITDVLNDYREGIPIRESIKNTLLKVGSGSEIIYPTPLIDLYNKLYCNIPKDAIDVLERLFIDIVEIRFKEGIYHIYDIDNYLEKIISLTTNYDRVRGFIKTLKIFKSISKNKLKNILEIDEKSLEEIVSIANDLNIIYIKDNGYISLLRDVDSIILYYIDNNKNVSGYISKYEFLLE